MAEHDTHSYLSLIRDFLENRLPASEFQLEYLKRWKTDTVNYSSSEYDILERMFEDCDAYWGEGQTPHTIGESELRACAEVALKNLEALMGRLQKPDLAENG